MDRRRCADRLPPRRNVPAQRYCSKPECQRQPCRRWQRQKLSEAPDYRANQAVVQGRWRERHPDYWRGYRQRHPAYTERNRQWQCQRNRQRGGAVTGPSPPGIAKMDAYVVEMRVLSGG